jgi:hypothetical protein
MNVKKIDLIWAAVSMFIVGFSFYHGWLLFGFVLIYVLMAAIFTGHIMKIKKSIRNTVTVYGTVKDYFEKDKGRHVYPILTYTTEEGRDVTSTYTVQDNKKRYDIGSEELICYDPQDPMFFYFAGREEELTRDYVRFLFIGGALAAIVLILALATM